MWERGPTRLSPAFCRWDDIHILLNEYSKDDRTSELCKQIHEDHISMVELNLVSICTCEETHKTCCLCKFVESLTQAKFHRYVNTKTNAVIMQKNSCQGHGEVKL